MCYKVKHYGCSVFFAALVSQCAGSRCAELCMWVKVQFTCKWYKAGYVEYTSSELKWICRHVEVVFFFFLMIINANEMQQISIKPLRFRVAFSRFRWNPQIHPVACCLHLDLTAWIWFWAGGGARTSAKDNSAPPEQLVRFSTLFCAAWPINLYIATGCMCWAKRKAILHHYECVSTNYH